MELLFLVFGLLLLGTGVGLVARALLGGADSSSRRLEQISAYGYSGDASLAGTGDVLPGEPFSERLSTFVGRIGERVGGRFSWVSESEMRKRLVSAGMYDVQPTRLFGYQVVISAVGAVLFLWVGALVGASLPLLVIGVILIVGFGLVLPIAYVDHRIRTRYDLIERSLPDLIDLLVVTLEAGLSFPQSLKMAAARVHGPLSQEVRITLQEQNMGLTLAEALTNFQERADTGGVRLFAKSVIQGETLGVSIGQIMRNLALEMRKRRKAYAEERAQKAPVKMLFPMILLIFPAIFIVLLIPVMITIVETL
jgi:tight adherence protein C